MKRTLAACIVLVLSAACGREFSGGPMSPSALPGVIAGQAPTISWNDATSAREVVSAQDHHLPGPSNFTFAVNGHTVHLGWQAAPGNVVHYIIEAGSISGHADLAVFSTGSNATGAGVTDVPTGIYFARVRAVLSDGQRTNVSNEIVVSVGGVCPGAVSPTAIAVPRTGATISIAVNTGCAWTAVSHSPFLSVVSGASGVSNGTVTVAIPENKGAARSGTLLIAGQVVTVTQGAANLHVAFEMSDPSTQAGVTTECRINANPSRCVLRSTSFTFGTTSLANYAWTVQYTYGGEVRTRTQSGIDPVFVLSEVCGLQSSDPSGAVQPLSVSLTVTDGEGATATAVSGAFGQPALQLRLYTCP